MGWWTRILVGILAVLAALVLFGPFLVSVRPLEGTVPPEQLADADSRFSAAGPVGSSTSLGGVHSSCPNPKAA